MLVPLTILIIFVSFLIYVNGCGLNPTNPQGGGGTGAPVQKMYMANKKDGVFVYNPAITDAAPFGTVEAVITFPGADRLYGVALSPDNKTLYALCDKINTSNSIATGEIFSYKLTSPHTMVSHEVTFANSAESYGNYILGFSADGSKMFVPLRKHVGVYTINATTLTPETCASWENECNGITAGVVSGNYVYFGNNASGKVYRYSISANTVEAEVNIIADNVWYIRLNSTGDQLIVPSQSSAHPLITNDIVYLVPIPSLGTPVALATVGDDPIDVGYSNNAESYTADYNSDTVSVYTTASGAFVKTISVEADMGPNTVTVDDARNRVYIAGFDHPRISIISTVTNTDLCDYIIPTAITDGTDQVAVLK